jgi:DNA-3-methyladenine glycosylase
MATRVHGPTDRVAAPRAAPAYGQYLRLHREVKGSQVFKSDIREFLSGPADTVAPELLGWTLSHTTPEGTVVVRLTEVEAYLGSDDPASHAFRRRTARNDVMFGPAGHLYVYRSHGLHWCSNVVTGAHGVASAVLLRAGRVVHGQQLAGARRGSTVSKTSLARGPGCLCRALGIDDSCYGLDVVGGSTLVLEPGDVDEVARSDIRAGARVGVSRGREVPLRFWIAADPTVSAYRSRAPQP